MSTRDVLIIGGGAAGASAAFHLAKAGHKVTVIEKKSTNTIKACGGGMAASVQRLFPFDLSPAVDEVINKVEFSWCLDDRVVADLAETSPFWIVRREMLDCYLMNQASLEGAELLQPLSAEKIEREKDSWQITCSNGKQFESRSLVIANGSKSQWPRKFGLGPKKQKHAVTTSVRLNGKGNLKGGSARFEFGLVHHGFAWAFPIANGVNVGVGTFIGREIADSQKILDKFLPDLGFDPNDGERKHSNLRIWNGQNVLHGEGVVAIGDAASLCDPFLAEGIRPALMSGCNAAHFLNRWLKGDNNALASYTQCMQKDWGASMAWGSRIAQVFYRFPKVGYQLGIKRPTAPERIAQILSGEMSYGDIAQRVIKRLLFQNQ
ncbi:geranylgeranyl reductase family protein [Prochlorococcus sp. MIT 1341]|uniref:NAD(P)/FAD-dependent oxidoreductase n=1 Tax=Prochlorococcus sp. MIT 1341 TaxID=3096221 RepID=UPI002A75A367|nr:geranylgeranyl reductase family protein [Prochlorococcus sp. MIT 1341]